MAILLHTTLRIRQLAIRASPGWGSARGVLPNAALPANSPRLSTIVCSEQTAVTQKVPALRASFGPTQKTSKQTTKHRRMSCSFCSTYEHGALAWSMGNYLDLSLWNMFVYDLFPLQRVWFILKLESFEFAKSIMQRPATAGQVLPNESLRDFSGDENLSYPYVFLSYLSTRGLDVREDFFCKFSCYSCVPAWLVSSLICVSVPLGGVRLDVCTVLREGFNFIGGSYIIFHTSFHIR